jgi:hypothetical protein
MLPALFRGAEPRPKRARAAKNAAPGGTDIFLRVTKWHLSLLPVEQALSRLLVFAFVSLRE